VPELGISVRLAALSCAIVLLPLCAQEPAGNSDQKQSQPGARREGTDFSMMPGAHEIRINLMPTGAQSYISQRPRSDSSSFDKPLWTSPPGTINKKKSYKLKNS